MDIFAATGDSVLTTAVDVTVLVTAAVTVAVVLFVVNIFVVNSKFKASIENIAALYKQVVVSEKTAVDYLNETTKALSKAIGEDLPTVQYGKYYVAELRDCNKTLWGITKNYGKESDPIIRENFFVTTGELENLDSYTRQFLQECKAAIVDRNDGLVGRIVLEINRKNVLSIYHQYEKYKKVREDYYAEVGNQPQLDGLSQEQ